MLKKINQKEKATSIQPHFQSLDLKNIQEVMCILHIPLLSLKSSHKMLTHIKAVLINRKIKEISETTILFLPLILHTMSLNWIILILTLHILNLTQTSQTNLLIKWTTTTFIPQAPTIKATFQITILTIIETIFPPIILKIHTARIATLIAQRDKILHISTDRCHLQKKIRIR